MKLFCDEMLGRLGRWLRAAGYDTAIAEGGTTDNDILARCMAEGRSIITRDRHLEARAEGRAPVVRLAENGIEAQARALHAALGLDWQHALFTRCLVDNTPLGPAPPEMSAQVPPSSRVAAGPLRLCPECGRLYWRAGISGACKQGSPPGMRSVEFAALPGQASVNQHPSGGKPWRSSGC